MSDDYLPKGYRWATAAEAEQWTFGEGLPTDEIWVNVGNDGRGNEFWDLAVPTDFQFEDGKTCPPIPGILE